MVAPTLETLARGNFFRREPVSIGAQLHRALRDAVIRGELLPGQVLTEIETSKKFGISRQPVREAFIKLAEEHLLEIRPQRGTYIRKISLREVLEAQLMREAIEVAFVRKVTPERDDVFAAALNDNIEQQKRLQPGDRSALWTLDEAFHRTITMKAAGDYAWRMLESIKAQMDRVRFLTYDDTTPISQIVAEHGELVAAVTGHDVERATRLMEGHLREILKSLPTVARRHPEYFAQE